MDFSAQERGDSSFLLFFRPFHSRYPAFHRSFPMVLDNHILSAAAVESFQNSFPQAVENLCGYLVLSAIFQCFCSFFLPKFAEIAEICFFSSVKFIRSSCFRKRLRSLWKTHEKPSFFPQKMLIYRPGSILPGRRKTGSQQSLPAGNFRWKRHWKTKNFCVSEKYTQICGKRSIFNQYTPIFSSRNHKQRRTFQELSTKPKHHFIGRKNG